MVAKLRGLRGQDAEASLQFRTIDKRTARNKDNNHDYVNDAYNNNMLSFVRYRMAEPDSAVSNPHEDEVPGQPCCDVQAATPAAETSHQFSPDDNISMHTEGGHYAQEVGTGNRLSDLDQEMAAGISLSEGQDGSGNPLVNADGSRAEFDGSDKDHVEALEARVQPKLEAQERRLQSPDEAPS